MIENNATSSLRTQAVCYFGVSEPDFGRNQIAVKGLAANGVKVIFCIDLSPRFLKFVRLIRKHWKIRKKYDVILVAYLSNTLVPLARLISRKKVVYNALNFQYEGTVLDRKDYSAWSLKGIGVWLLDFLAFHCAHLSLVESESQKRFIRRMFNVSEKKLAVVYTGADDSIFYPDPLLHKRDTYTVLFRGWFLPGTGVEYVLEAAKILRDEGVRFLIIGRGKMLPMVEKMIKDYDLTNVELITAFLSDEELHEKMLSCHVMLGQFADHPRMDRTIQYKTFEALALGMPYITEDSVSNREILTDRENCLFVKKADAEDLAHKILIVRDDLMLREKIAHNAYALYREKFTPKALAREMLEKVAVIL